MTDEDDCAAKRSQPVFERFTDDSRRVVVVARIEARRLRHGHVGTEHLLLALIRDGDAGAAELLRSLGVRPVDVRRQVEDDIGLGEERLGEDDYIPFTQRAKRALELSHREAMRLGHRCVETEHLLLGLLREGEGVGAQVLARAGIGFERVREQVVRMRVGEGVHGESDAELLTGAIQLVNALAADRGLRSATRRAAACLSAALAGRLGERPFPEPTASIGMDAASRLGRQWHLPGRRQPHG